MHDPTPPTPAVLPLENEAATRAFGAALAPCLVAGDTLLLEGNVGAGKSFLARAIIQTRLAALGRTEDVPSPTFTLVQTYDLDTAEVWHADLYRLGDSGEIAELGMDAAFETAICLIEWPDRLGPYRPASAVTLRLGSGAGPDARVLTIDRVPSHWAQALASFQAGAVG